MYIYNYIHVWRAARNVKNLPANNYAAYPFLLRRYSATILMLIDHVRAVFQHTMETLTYGNKVLDVALFKEYFPTLSLFDKAADYL